MQTCTSKELFGKKISRTRPQSYHLYDVHKKVPSKIKFHMAGSVCTLHNREDKAVVPEQ